MFKALLRRDPLLAIILSATLAAGPARADVVSDAREVIRSMGDTVVAILANKGLPKPQREERFRVIYKANFAHTAIASFVMGPLWRTASPTEREDYLNLFETFVTKVYTAQLSTYTGERFEVTGAEPDGNGATVHSRIVDPKSSRIVEIKWRVHPTDGALKVRDVLIENLSMSQTQRREFASVAQQRGGTAAGLIAALREKVAQLERN